VPLHTDLKNPDFGEVAKAMGLWGAHLSKADELQDSIKAWLAQPGSALLHVKVKPMQLVMPPSPFVSPEAVVGMEVYRARAVLQGKGHDVRKMVTENIPGRGSDEVVPEMTADETRPSDVLSRPPGPARPNGFRHRPPSALHQNPSRQTGRIRVQTGVAGRLDGKRVIVSDPTQDNSADIVSLSH
jgi:hypothetical protein